MDGHKTMKIPIFDGINMQIKPISPKTNLDLVHIFKERKEFLTLQTCPTVGDCKDIR